MNLRTLQLIALDIAQVRPSQDVLEQIVSRLASEPEVVLARIWLIGPGDLCSSCVLASECKNRTSCLHLQASAGHSVVDPDIEWTATDGRFRRFPLGVRKIGGIGASGKAAHLRLADNSDWVVHPDWTAQEKVLTFAGQPLIFQGETLGVLGLFSRVLIDEEQFSWLRTFADQAAVALANAKAFHDLEEMSKELEAKQELETRMLHQQKLESLGILAGGLAHDFNNLLAGVLGYADLALENTDADSKSQNYLLKIIGSATRASELCNQMLAYSGKGKFLTEIIDISHTISETLGLIKVALPKKVELVLDCTDELTFIEVDPTQVRQVLMNLVTNAAEAIGDDSGQVTIATRVADFSVEALLQLDLTCTLSSGRYVTVEIQDTGSGMSDEVMSKIFDPFFTTKFTGRGLGLAAVQGIIKSHQGLLVIHSIPEVGTSMTTLWPASAKPQPIVAPSQTNLAKQSGGTILFVDDEELLRSLVERMLSKLGYNVLLAADGDEAVQVFKAHQPVISGVILDLTMPIKNGEETYRELVKIDPAVKVIYTTGYTEQEIQHRYNIDGGYNLLTKPFDLNKLSSLLSKTLSS